MTPRELRLREKIDELRDALEAERQDRRDMERDLRRRLARANGQLGRWTQRERDLNAREARLRTEEIAEAMHDIGNGDEEWATFRRVLVACPIESTIETIEHARLVTIAVLNARSKQSRPHAHPSVIAVGSE